MKVIDILNNSKKTLFSFELLPPLKGHNIETIFSTIDKLKPYNPAYINITYHREEVVYTTNSNGVKIPVKLRRRPGTVGLSAAIQQKYAIDVVPHIICGGFDAHETEDALIDLDFLGINNILAVRGDADKITGRFEAKPGGHNYAIDLVKQVANLNKGIYLEKLMEEPKPTNFCIGVAGYPEKHPESPNCDSDIHYLKKKVEAGASYIVTQMFFDNRHYFRFVKRCREAGIKVPIIPGLKPISVKHHLNILPKVFDVHIPQELVLEVEKCKTNAEVTQLGVEWAIAQSKDLVKANVPALHFYTMGKADNIAQIAKNVF
ncbi:MAG: methylenetetrahydrofolate reductase [Tenuifilum sp.]|jgi:methylenetetrahydrofolate reductase (NADPH)|uniref:methylenetetrahydrofolate reductase [NAD(P)H] n=1 Tax=Tenuifilum sp. TaxID=2760880 RepID=UPI0024ABCDC4|nr:methylenetetrahydrofolate reductase [NAD(P)H] [Tenuifilum sp.]MDI3526009.1 methylenetetrahydrofolate reductase [Tenuifilum sp.]